MLGFLVEHSTIKRDIYIFLLNSTVLKLWNKKNINI